jgi:curli biogenesis system outer membrane secretion channel CsgG
MTLSLLTQPAEPQSRRLKIAIYPFDQSNVEFNIQKELGGKVNYGDVAADMLVAELGAGFEIINRNQMARILEEQGRKYDERFDPTQAAEFGKLFGADAIVVGSVNDLHVEKQTAAGVGGLAQTVGGIFGGRGRRVPDVNTTTTTVNARVELTAELISTVTGKTVGVKALGSERKVLAGNLDVNRPAGTNANTAVSNSGYDPYIRNALRQAVQDVAGQLTSRTGDVPKYESTGNPPAAPGAKPAEVKAADNYTALPNEVGNVWKSEGKVLSFFVSPGVKISAGDVLEVQRSELVKHPRTGKMIATGEKIGSVTVTKATAEIGEGTYEGRAVTDKDRVVKP